MRKYRLTRWFTSLAALIVIAILPANVLSLSRAQQREVTLRAGDFGYTPAVIHVNPGDILTIELVAADAAHGIAIDGYDVKIMAFPGQPTSVTFVADKIGAFRIRCTVTCGALHPFMIGKLIVGRNDQFIKGILLLGIALTIMGIRSSHAPKARVLT